MRSSLWSVTGNFQGNIAYGTTSLSCILSYNTLENKIKKKVTLLLASKKTLVNSTLFASNKFTPQTVDLVYFLSQKEKKNVTFSRLKVYLP